MKPVYIVCNVTGKPKVGLMHSVAAMILERGSGTVDELLPELDGMERQRAVKILQNAAQADLIHCLGKPKRRGGAKFGSEPARYYPGPKPGKQPKVYKPRRSIFIRPPASAWELSHGRQIAGQWPPAFHGARRCAPLGDWNAE